MCFILFCVLFVTCNPGVYGAVRSELDAHRFALGGPDFLADLRCMPWFCCSAKAMTETSTWELLIEARASPELLRVSQAEESSELGHKQVKPVSHRL